MLADFRPAAEMPPRLQEHQTNGTEKLDRASPVGCHRQIGLNCTGCGPSVNPNRERKSSGSETTFDTDLVEPDLIEAGVLAKADDVWTWCEKPARARTVTVKIKWADFQQSTRSRSLGSCVASRGALRAASLALIRSVHPPPKGIRLVGVTLSNFQVSNEPAPDELALK